MSKSLFSTLVDVEAQMIALERARAVLDEAVAYLEEVIKHDTWQAHYFIEHGQHRMMLLLHASGHLLADIEPELKRATDDLLEIHKEMKEEKS